MAKHWSGIFSICTENATLSRIWIRVFCIPVSSGLARGGGGETSDVPAAAVVVVAVNGAEALGGLGPGNTPPPPLVVVTLPSGLEAVLLPGEVKVEVPNL